MSTPRLTPSLREAAEAMRYTTEEKKNLTKTGLTFIVAGIAFVAFSIAAWISGPAPEVPAMLELDEIERSETYRAGDLSQRLEAAYVEPEPFTEGYRLVFEVATTNHGTYPYRPTVFARPVVFSGVTFTVEEAVTRGFEPQIVDIPSDPGTFPSINPGTSAVTAYIFPLTEEDVEFLTSGGEVRVYYQRTSLAAAPDTVPNPEWTTPTPAAWLVTGIEDRR